LRCAKPPSVPATTNKAGFLRRCRGFWTKTEQRVLCVSLE
jgi:hypothetical protein